MRGAALLRNHGGGLCLGLGRLQGCGGDRVGVRTLDYFLTSIRGPATYVYDEIPLSK